MRDLAGFTGSGYDKGRSGMWRAAWIAVERLAFRPVWVPGRFRASALRLFGAEVGLDVVIRHGVRVLWPWKLSVGDHSWIGEGAWLLNLEPITIGSNVCISQEVLLCTGSHDRASSTFEFDNGPISIGDGSWVAARAVILRGVTVGREATIGATALVADDVPDRAVVLAPRANPLPTK